MHENGLIDAQPVFSYVVTGHVLFFHNCIPIISFSIFYSMWDKW